jgi:prepilin-type N-terminal cleavage/methylation domain-containing protein/prepilin-type processing-associated H-X9-DG protein
MKHNKHAFTLIELLVVIAIIAVLAAILFPVFAQARSKARQASCLSNTKQVITAVLAYAQDYDEVTPTQRVYGAVTDWNNQFAWGAANGVPGGPYYWLWAHRIQPYVKNWSVYVCPSSDPTEAPIYYWDDWTCMATASCWSQYRDNVWQGWLSYGHGSWMQRGLAEMDRPVDTVALADSPYYGLQGYNSGRWNVTMGHTAQRHNGGLNVAFFDGHSKWLKLEQGGSPILW